MHHSTLMDAVRGVTLGWAVDHHRQNLLHRYIRSETFSMLDSVLQHRHRRAIEAELLQPLRRASDVISLRGDKHPVHLERLAGTGHKAGLHPHESIRRFDRKPGHWATRAQQQLMTARLLQ